MFTERQNLLLALLREQGRTTGDALAATLQVSKRTVYRDLGALIEAGIAIRTEGGPGGGIWIDEPAQTRTAPITAISTTEEGLPSADDGETIEDAIARYERTANPESSPAPEYANREDVGGRDVTAEQPAVPNLPAAESVTEPARELSIDPVAHWFDQAFGKREVTVPVVVEVSRPVEVEEGEDVPPASTVLRSEDAHAGISAPTAAAPAVSVNLAAVVRERIFLDASGWWQEEMPSQMVVDLLQEAIFTNRMMRVQFHASSANDVYAGMGTTVRVIEPYGLVAKAGVWYLVSRQGTHFVADRLSRIATAEQLSGRFERVAGFELETWWSRSGDQFARGNEQYRFTALVRKNRIEFLRMYVGGRVQVDAVDAQWSRARLEVASPEAAVMIVLGLGQDAVVIEPDELPLFVRRAAAGRPLHEVASPARPTPNYALG